MACSANFATRKQQRQRQLLLLLLVGWRRSQVAVEWLTRREAVGGGGGAEIGAANANFCVLVVTLLLPFVWLRFLQRLRLLLQPQLCAQVSTARPLVRLALPCCSSFACWPVAFINQQYALGAVQRAVNYLSAIMGEAPYYVSASLLLVSGRPFGWLAV